MSGDKDNNSVIFIEDENHVYQNFTKDNKTQNPSNNLNNCSRNLAVDIRHTGGNNSTLKMAFTCGNNSQIQEEYTQEQLQPLKSIDNKQAFYYHQQQLIQLFSPSKLLTTNKPLQKNLLTKDDHKNYEITPRNNNISDLHSMDEHSIMISEPVKTQIDQFYKILHNRQAKEPIQSRISKVLDFENVDKTSRQQRLKILQQSEEEIVYKTTDRNQDGPSLYDSLIKEKARAKNKPQKDDSEIAMLSEIATQGEVLQPHSIKCFKQFDKQGKKSPSSKLKATFQSRKSIRAYEESEASSIFNENVGISEGFDKRFKKKQFLKEVQNPHMNLNQQSELPIEEDEEYECLSLATLQYIQPKKKINQMIELNLRLANLKELSPTIFTQNIFLKNVDIRNNRINKVPDTICDLPTLWKLRVDYNYITDLPERIGSLSLLEFLSASYNKIQSLPDSLFELGSTLTHLIINDNKISQLQDQIGQLENLNILMLHNNMFAELPFSLCMIKRLMEFSLDWFIYQDTQKLLSKHMKGELGLLNIREFLNFLKGFVKNCENKMKQISFLHFLMYYHKLRSINEIQHITYSQKKRTIFHLMALNGNLYLFEYLLKISSHLYLDYNRADVDDSTPFLLAIRNKRKDFFKYLLSLSQTNINRASTKYGTPLHLALKSQEFKLSLQLLKGCGIEFHRHVDVNSINVEDGSNNALHYLFMNFYVRPEIAIEIARQLIKKNININFKNKNGHTPLHLAILSNQLEAINFALEYNKGLRAANKEVQSHQLFDFNLRGGKFNQNPLFMTIQQNNLKIINALLYSNEILDFLAVDDEGRIPKDICPYNSPIYKLLYQYEQKVHNRLREDAYDNSEQSKQSERQDINQYYYNKRFYESPQRIRMKILEKAKIKDDKLKSTILQQSLNAGGRQNVVALQSCKNAKTKDKVLFGEAKQGYIRMQSMNNRYKNGKQKEGLRDSEEFLSSGGEEDEASNLEIMKQPKTGQQSANFSLISNFGRQSNKPSITPVLQKDISIDYFLKTDDKYEQEIKIHRERMQNVRLSLSSSGSQTSRTLGINKDSITDRSYRNQDFILPLAFRARDHFSSRVFAQNERADFKDKQESVIKEKFEDDDDDANIPEEEHEVEIELQKSSMRVFNKSPSQNAFYNEFSNDAGLDKFIKTIINEIESQNEIRNKNSLILDYTQQNNLQTIPTQDLMMSTKDQMYLSNSGSIMQEQGNQNQDLSQIYQIQDESMGIQLPFDPTQTIKGPITLLKHTANKYNNFLLDFEEKEYQIYQKFFCYLSKNNLEGCLSIIRDLCDSQFKMIQVDLIYYLTFNQNLNEIKTTINLSMKTQRINKKIMEYYMFELINSHEIKLYEKQNQLRLQIQILEYQKLQKAQDIINYQSNQNQIYSLEEGPILKVRMRKSPSLIILDDLPSHTRNGVQMIQSSDIGQTTQLMGIALSPRSSIFDIKQLITSRKSLDFSTNKPKLLSSNSGIFQQIKKPLVEREFEYQQNLSKQPSIQKFQKNYDLIFRNQSHTSKAMDNTQTLQMVHNKNSKYLQNIQLNEHHKQKSQISINKPKKVETPNPSKFKTNMKKSSAQKIQIYDPSTYLPMNPLLNSAPGKTTKTQQQSRNNTTQLLFSSQESLQKDNITMVIPPQNNAKGLTETKLKEQSHQSEKIKESRLNIQIFSQDEIESLQDQLRIKNKWHVLKQSHTQKMNKVSSSAVKRKNMFNQVMYDSQRSNENSSYLKASSMYNSQIEKKAGFTNSNTQALTQMGRAISRDGKIVKRGLSNEKGQPIYRNNYQNGNSKPVSPKQTKININGVVMRKNSMFTQKESDKSIKIGPAPVMQSINGQVEMNNKKLIKNMSQKKIQQNNEEKKIRNQIISLQDKMISL